MLASAGMRERSHTLCLSLHEFGEIYQHMPNFDDAEAAERRTLEEARHRYDTSQQTRITHEILGDVAAERELGMENGAAVRLHGLVQRRRLREGARESQNKPSETTVGHIWDQAYQIPDDFQRGSLP